MCNMTWIMCDEFNFYMCIQRSTVYFVHRIYAFMHVCVLYFVSVGMYNWDEHEWAQQLQVALGTCLVVDLYVLPCIHRNEYNPCQFNRSCNLLSILGSGTREEADYFQPCNSVSGKHATLTSFIIFDSLMDKSTLPSFLLTQTHPTNDYHLSSNTYWISLFELPRTPQNISQTHKHLPLLLQHRVTVCKLANLNVYYHKHFMSVGFIKDLHIGICDSFDFCALQVWTGVTTRHMYDKIRIWLVWYGVT